MSPSEIAEIVQYAKYFNQRFGQYLVNAVSIKHNTTDIFYVSDNEIIVACREYYYNHYKEPAHEAHT